MAYGTEVAYREAHRPAPPASHGASNAPSAIAGSACPELDCLRDDLPYDLIELAERSAGVLGVGADRVLVANRIVAEEEYVDALGAWLGIAIEPLDDAARSACPLSDERLIDAAGAGLVPLRTRDGLSWVIAPRGLAARRLTQLIAAQPPLAARVRLTTEANLHRFVGRAAAHALEDRAVNTLWLKSPDLSAAPRPRFGGLLRFATLCAAIAGAAVFAPYQTLLALDVALALGFLAWIALRLLGSFTPPPRRATRRVADAALPIYTIIVALYREAASVGGLIEALSQFDYPVEKLDIKLVLEADDVETQDAVARLDLGPAFQVLIAPSGGPRTKPKALNAALAFARGSFVAVFDAEDRPERDQLRVALQAFARGGGAIGCVQARLTIDNTADGWMARMFTAEYAGQFDVFLPGLDALELPLPLGGSSNHFRTDVLRGVGGWDPHNVTEDADLGIRLARFGYRCAVVFSSTYEEAPPRFGPWLRQRTRWFKGWMQTWVVHMRRPATLLHDLRGPGFATFHLAIGGNVLASLIHPVFLVSAAYLMLSERFFTDDALEFALMSLHGTTIVGGYAASALLGLMGLARRGLLGCGWVLLLLPLHWLLLSLAAWRALFQLIRQPQLWEKTEHGLARTSRRLQR